MSSILLKIVLRGFKISLSLVLLLSALLWWGLGTQTGLHWLANTVHLFVPGTLAIKEIKGNVFAHLELIQLQYKDDEISLGIDKLVLSWKPGELLKKTLLIDELLLQHIAFKQLKPADASSQDATIAVEDNQVFTEINLPFTFKFNKFLATDIRIDSATENTPDAKPTLINEISFTAQWQQTQLAVDELQLRLPEYAMLASGDIQTVVDFPHELALKLWLSMAGMPEISTTGSVQGDMQKLNIKQRSTLNSSESPFFDIALQLEDLLTDLHWDTDFDIKQFPLETFWPDVKEKVNLSGRAEGDLEQLQVYQVKGEVFNGTLNLDGQLVYAPDLAWKTELIASEIDPGFYNAEFPGNINFGGTVEGKWKNDQLGLNIDLQQLTGTLREQPVTGSGVFTLEGEEMLFDNVVLGSGKSQVKIDGELAQNYKLEWAVNIPDLNELLPEGKGLIKGKGHVKGSRTHPIATGAVKINDLAYLQYASQMVELEFNIDTDLKEQSEISAIAKTVNIDNEKLDSMILQAKGPLDNHQIKFSAQHVQAKLQLAARGGYLKEKSTNKVSQEPAWKGSIEQLDIDAQHVGRLTLKSASKLYLSQEKVKLSPLCLIQPKTELCSAIDLLQGRGRADINLKGLSLSRIKTYLPEDITHLDGDLAADVVLDIGPLLKADINAVLGSGILTYLVDESHQVRLHHQGGLLRGQLKDKEFNAQFNLSVGEHGAQGKISIPRKNLENDTARAPLQGDIFLQVKDLGLLTAFVPEIQESEGNIIAQLRLHGLLSEPLISGHATLTSTRAAIPSVGIELKNTHFEILGKGSRELSITGQSDSGDGTVKLKGILQLDGEQNWPLQMTLTGNNFQAVNLPQAQIYVTPEVELQHNKDGLFITGSITIPEAEITPRTIPEGSYSVSSDVVIVSAENPVGNSQDSTPLEARIKLVMGNNVHVKAFGLNAFLGGQMTIHQRPQQLATANGDLKIISGTYRALGQNLTIEQGRLSYAGGHLDNPGLNLRATREIRDETVGVSMSGTLQSPNFSVFSSVPGMTKANISSMLLTGQTMDNLDQARFYAERNITRKLSVGVNAGGGDEGSEFVARYKLRRNVHVEATSSAQKSGGRILYTIEIE